MSATWSGWPLAIDGLGSREVRLVGEKCKAHPQCKNETRTFYGGKPFCQDDACVEAIRRRYASPVKGAQAR